MIRGKFREEQGGWCSKEVRGGYGVGLWKAIRREWHVVSSRLSFVVGNGQMVKFWKDRWCGDSPLCVSFPTLFALAVSKDAWVKDVWSSTEGGGLEPVFSRPFNDWEVDEVHRFFLGLNGKRVQQEVEDRVLWRETKCGKFSVKSLYKALVLGPLVSFPSTVIWKACVQPKVSFLGGKQCGEKLLLWTNFRREDDL